MQNIRWGIIGPGRIAHKFAQDISQVPNCSLMAVASRNEKRARDFARAYDAKYAFDSYQSLVKCKEVDAIYIATPHSFHKEHTLLCLQHKIPVLCEKPFAMNAKEVEEMIAVSKDQNILLMEALWTAFIPSFQSAMDLIQQGKYGKILSLKADFGFFTPFN